MYQLNIHTKHTEEDSYQEGANPNTSAAWALNDTFTADTLDELIGDVMSAYQVDRDSLITYEDEPGRLDIQRMENADGYEPSALELESWRKGNCKLWIADFSGEVTKLESVDLTKVLQSA